MARDAQIGGFLSPSDCQTTDAYAHAQKTFYPSEIHIGHPQLRHLITSPSLRVVYFVNGRTVHCLDTVTQKRTNVAELPFEAICIATGHGWFCAGGENSGYFAAFSITGPSPQHSSVLPPRIRVERLGEMIVNSISIHKVCGTGQDADEEVVAILTNNDTTVRMYSLTRDCEIGVVAFEFAMNHATISPDGKLLMIVGDKEIAYFYSRRDLPKDQTTKTRGFGNGPLPGWALLRELPLHKSTDPFHAGYFTTAWSPTGRFCATASENGYITLLDVAAISELDSNPTLAIVPSSRPHTGPGGVRTMCFSPDPWDLLLWTEDHGRMCIADLRTGLRRRQIIHLDSKADGVTKIKPGEVTLLNAYLSIDPDLELRRTPTALQDQMYIGTDRHWQRGIRGVPMIDNAFLGLTEHEQQILDGLRTTRQREDVLRSGDSSAITPQLTPRSINYTVPPGQRRNWAQGQAALGPIRAYVREQSFSEGTTTTTRTGATRTSSIHAPASSTQSDPWQTIEAAMRTASSEVSDGDDDDDDDDGDNDDDGIPPLIGTGPNDSSLPRSFITVPTLRAIRADLQQEVSALSAERRRRLASNTWDSGPPGLEGALRDSERLAELNGRVGVAQAAIASASNPSDATLRRRLEELEAELEAAENRRVTHAALTAAADNEALEIQQRIYDSSSTRTASAARDSAERQRLLLAMATRHAQLDAVERRQRFRDARTMVAGIPISPRRDTSLTTRGEAVLAREQRERERRMVESSQPGDGGLMAAYEHSLQAIRRMHRNPNATTGFVSRPATATRARTFGAVGDEARGAGTTGVAWGEGRNV